MELNEYQNKIAKFAHYGAGNKVFYPALGLSGEVGELNNKIKKVMRGDLTMEELDKDDITKELGDVLWYVARLADDLDIPLEVVAEMNIKKLSSRHDRGVIKGNGDNR
jgi:NTP pyrophosphatase (non-canonical NTP hydrolase)